MKKLVFSDAAAVYALLDPRSSSVRYIGRSVKPERRMAQHMCCDDDTYRSRWINSLKRAGLRPTLKILCWAEVADARRIEAKLVRIHRAKNSGLTNTTSGGDGANPGGRLTRIQALKKKISLRRAAKRKMQSWTPEQWKKYRSKKVMSLLSKDTIRRIRTIKVKRAAARRKELRVPEIKRIEAAKARWANLSSEQRARRIAKLQDGRKNWKPSSDHGEKIRAGQRRFRDDPEKVQLSRLNRKQKEFHVAECEMCGDLFLRHLECRKFCSTKCYGRSYRSER